MILPGLQSHTLSIQDLQRVIETKGMLSPKKHPALVEFKVCIRVCVCLRKMFLKLYTYEGFSASGKDKSQVYCK